MGHNCCKNDPEPDSRTVRSVGVGLQAAKARGRGADRAYAGRYFLSPTTLKSMTDLKRQFAELLAEIGGWGSIWIFPWNQGDIWDKFKLV